MPEYSVKLKKESLNKKELLILALKNLGVKEIQDTGSSRYLGFSCSEDLYHSFVETYQKDFIANGTCCCPAVRKEIFPDALAKNNYRNAQQLVASVQNLPDGSGIDVIVVDPDGGVANDPELPQVEYVDWRAFAGMPESLGPYPQHPENGAELGSANIHGVSVASIICSKALGWAKNVNLYFMKNDDMRSGGIDYHPDAIMNWHDSKPINDFGFRRPTIVVCSWSYSEYDFILRRNFTNSDEGAGNTAYTNYISYRGDTYEYNPASGTPIDYLNTYQVGHTSSFGNYAFATSQREDLDTVDDTIYIYRSTLTEEEDPVKTASWRELANHSGIVCVASASNDSRRIVPSGHIDYNNFINYTFWDSLHRFSTDRTVYYNRPHFPAGAGFITVGSVNPTTDRKKSAFSACGPAVDVYAPGEDLVTLGAGQYTTNTDGTSFACPQVAGLLASYLTNPDGIISPEIRKVDDINTQSDISTSTARLFLIKNSIPKMHPSYDVDSTQPNSIQAPAEYNRVPNWPSNDPRRPAVISPLSPSPRDLDAIYTPSIYFESSTLYNLLHDAREGETISTTTYMPMSRNSKFITSTNGVLTPNNYHYFHEHRADIYAYPHPTNRINRYISAGEVWLNCQQDMLQSSNGSSVRVAIGGEVGLSLTDTYEESAALFLFGQSDPSDIHRANAFQIGVRRTLQAGWQYIWRDSTWLLLSLTGEWHPPLAPGSVEGEYFPRERDAYSFINDHAVVGDTTQVSDEVFELEDRFVQDNYVNIALVYTKGQDRTNVMELRFYDYDAEEYVTVDSRAYGIFQDVDFPPAPFVGNMIGFRNYSKASSSRLKTCDNLNPSIDDPAAIVFNSLFFYRS